MLDSPRTKRSRNEGSTPNTPETPILSKRLRIHPSQEMTPTKEQFFTSPIKKTPSKDDEFCAESESSSETDQSEDENKSSIDRFLHYIN